jgi:multiple sugar transport system substrate-binding protein
MLRWHQEREGVCSVAQEIVLKGMTWSDPRGYDPVVAAAAAFAGLVPGVRIDWDKRSLQGFESTPVDELAAAYDLMVIDHPHVGAVVAEDCLLPLDRHAPAESLLALEGETVGKSFASYRLAGHQWALPIDAATQVQAIRPDRQPQPLRRWDEVMAAARDGAVLWPLRPPHVLMSFYTLCANLGDPCAVTRGPLVARETGRRVMAALQALADLVDPACRAMDPIAALDALADSRTHRLIPLTYLYSPYSRPGYRPQAIAFHDIPAIGDGGPIGSALGGTGIAVSARTAHPELCTRFALWLASAEVQRGLYAAHNGQPGNARAWGDAAVNAGVGNAYAQTRLTHEAAWLRPRHAGYMAFQEAGSHIVLDAITGRTPHETALDALDLRFIESFPE